MNYEFKIPSLDNFPEISAWLSSNAEGSWEVEDCVERYETAITGNGKSFPGTLTVTFKKVLFEDENDAAAYRLRWG